MTLGKIVDAKITGASLFQRELPSSKKHHRNQFSEAAFSSLKALSAVPEQVKSLRQDDCDKPWSLDDCDPKTIDDQKNIEKAQNAIKFLKNLLPEQGLKPGQADGCYEEFLAIGLYYFVDTPAAVKGFQYSHLVERTKELKEVGLGKFQQYLLEKGGLGTALMREDAEHEVGAAESLRQGKGFCTEKSKILYQVFKMADLKPFFVFLKNADYRKTYQAKGLTIPRDLNDTDHHVYLGVAMGEKQLTRYFDLTLVHSFGSDADFLHPKHLTEKEYISLDLYVKARTKNPKEAIPLLNQALEHDAKNLFAYKELGELYEVLGDRESDPDQKRTWYRKGENIFRQALDIDSTDAGIWNNYGVLLAKQVKVEEAKQAYQRTLQLEPNHKFALENLGRAYLHENDLLEAENCFRRVWKTENSTEYAALVAMVFLNHCSLNQNANNEFYKEVNKYPKKYIRELSEKVTGYPDSKKIDNIYDHFALAFAHFANNDFEKALSESQKLIEFFPQEPLFYSLQSFCFEGLNQPEKAAKLQELAWEKAKNWLPKE